MGVKSLYTLVVISFIIVLQWERFPHVCLFRESPQIIKILLPSGKKRKDGSKTFKGNEKQVCFFFFN